MNTVIFNNGDSEVDVHNYLPLEAFKFPVTDGLTGLFLFGDGSANVVRNFAGGDDAVIVGNVVSYDGYSRFNGYNGYLQTAIPESPNMCIAAIARRPAQASTSQAFIATNYQSGAYLGVSMGISASNGLQAAISRADGSGTFSTTAESTEFFVSVLEIPESGASKIYNLTRGAGNTSSNAGERTLTGAGNMRIGGSYSTNDATYLDIVAIAIFNKGSFTSDERAKLKAWFDDYKSQFV